MKAYAGDIAHGLTKPLLIGVKQGIRVQEGRGTLLVTRLPQSAYVGA